MGTGSRGVPGRVVVGTCRAHLQMEIVRSSSGVPLPTSTAQLSVPHQLDIRSCEPKLSGSQQGEGHRVVHL